MWADITGTKGDNTVIKNHLLSPFSFPERWRTWRIVTQAQELVFQMIFVSKFIQLLYFWF